MYTNTAVILQTLYWKYNNIQEHLRWIFLSLFPLLNWKYSEIWCKEIIVLWVLWFCFTQFSLDFTLEKAGAVRVPGQIMILLQTSVSAEKMENSSMCWINLYSVYLANIYLKATFSLLQSAINPSAEELGLKPNWYISFTSVYLTCVLFERTW